MLAAVCALAAGCSGSDPPPPAAPEITPVFAGPESPLLPKLAAAVQAGVPPYDMQAALPAEMQKHRTDLVPRPQTDRFLLRVVDDSGTRQQIVFEYWDINQRAKVGELTPSRPFLAQPQAFSSNGWWLLATDGTGAYVVDAESGQTRWLARVRSPNQFECHGAFSPDSKLLITLRETEPLRVWDLSSGEMTLEHDLGGTPLLQGMAVIPGTKQIALVEGASQIRIVDWETGKTQKTIHGGGISNLRRIIPTADGKQLIIANTYSFIIDIASGEKLYGWMDGSTPVAILPGHDVVLRTKTADLRLTNLHKNADLATFAAHEETVLYQGEKVQDITGAISNHDGSKLVSLGYSETLKFWDLHKP